MTKLNNDINDFEISDGKNHVLYFTDDKLKLRTIDIDVQPIIDAIETTIYNMLDAKQLKYNGLKNGLDVILFYVTGTSYIFVIIYQVYLMKRFSPTAEAKLKWYVYSLQDVNGKIAYVGKGTGSRVYEHRNSMHENDSIKISG